MHEYRSIDSVFVFVFFFFLQYKIRERFSSYVYAAEKYRSLILSFGNFSLEIGYGD